MNSNLIEKNEEVDFHSKPSALLPPTGREGRHTFLQKIDEKIIFCRKANAFHLGRCGDYSDGNSTIFKMRYPISNIFPMGFNATRRTMYSQVVKTQNGK